MTGDPGESTAGVAERIARLPAAKRALLERALLERALLDRGRRGVRAGRIPRRATTGPAPLSYAQRGMWFLDQWQPGSALYGVRSAFRLRGPLDVRALRRAFDAVVARHEILRTTFTAVDGRPVQVVAPPAAVPLPVIDLSALDPAERDAGIRDLREAETRRPFDLARGPLLRAALALTADDEQVLLLSLHHTVADGWSYALLTRELSACYAAFREGGSPALPELPVQFADFAAWQEEHLRDESVLAQLEWWKSRLTDSPPLLGLETDRPRPAVLSHRGAGREVRVPPVVAEALRELGLRTGATPFMVLLAAFKALLHRYTGAADVVVGCPVAGRVDSELEQLVGCFVNTLALRTDLGADPTFPELVERVRDTTLAAHAHQDVPFEWLVQELRLERSTSHTPVFQVVFVLENTPQARWDLPGVAVRELPVDHPAEAGDLSMTLRDTGDGLVGTLSYSTDLFEADTAARFVEHFELMLAAIAEAPDRPISALPLPTGPAGRGGPRARVLNADLRPVPHGAIGGLFLTGVRASAGGVQPDRFVTDPVDGGPLYRTGDLARWTDDGGLEIVRGRDVEVRAPETGRSDSTGQADQPLADLLHAIWCEVLGVERVDPATNFFEAGGHSLLAIQVVARVRKALGVDLGARELFDAPTPAAFACRVEAAREARTGPVRPAIEPREGAGPAPLSHAQRRLWFIDQLDRSGAHHNVCSALDLDGPLWTAAFAGAVDGVRRRHDSLRTTICQTGGLVEQSVAEHEPVPTPLVDLSGLGAAEAEQAARRLAESESRRPFDLGRGPLLRVTLVRLGPTRHMLLATVHHIVTDAWSTSLLFEELWQLYDARVRHVAPQLPPSVLQYADYAAWEQRHVTESGLAESARYWQRQLGGAPAGLDLGYDRALPMTPVFASATLPFELTPEETRELVAFSLREGVTLFTTVLSAYLVLLHRRTRQSDIVVGTGTANRESVEVERVIGFFTNQLVLRTAVSGEETVRELLARVREVTLNAYAHQDMPFDRLVELLRPPRVVNRAPLFQVEIEYHRSSDRPQGPPGLTVTPRDLHNPTTTLDLSLHVVQTETVVKGGLVYNAEAFTPATARRMLGEWRALLGAMAAGPGTPVEAVASRIESEWREEEGRARAAAARARFDTVRARPVRVVADQGRR